MVYILLVNWNGWKDTIECLESVFRIDHPHYRVVVCDNSSADGSVDLIKAWAAGNLDVWLPEGNPMRRLSYPPLPKPIPFLEYGREEAEGGGNPRDPEARLVLIRCGSNLGYAGGNNVGLRYALARKNFRYAWLLNNDTVVEPDALAHLLWRMEEAEGAGMCGSTLPFYDSPGTIWTRGGAVYNPWTLHAAGIDHREPASLDVDPRVTERRMNYVAGASLLVSLPFLREVGLMSEEYFLYFEELDWTARIRGRYRLAYAPRSVVYHKVGASMESFGGTLEGNRKLRKIIYRSALLYTRKHVPWCLPMACLSMLLRQLLWHARNLAGLRRERRSAKRSGTAGGLS